MMVRIRTKEALWLMNTLRVVDVIFSMAPIKMSAIMATPVKQ
jgi:hypothetical protein